MIQTKSSSLFVVQFSCWPAIEMTPKLRSGRVQRCTQSKPPT